MDARIDIAGDNSSILQLKASVDAGSDIIPIAKWQPRERP
jgi:hypothetical protein